MTSSIPARAFTIGYNGRANAIITDLEVAAAFDPNNMPVPPPNFHPTTALWDTGATKSVITTSTVKALNLKPQGKAWVSHAGGKNEVNTYLVNFRLLPNLVIITGIIASECTEIVNQAGALIGMDIITLGDFVITNLGGKTLMSYRIPSSARTDYVKETNYMIYAGTPRNAPCPCGSGKKYKKCHGA